MHPFLVSTLVVAATWDAWRWYVERVWAAPEEAAALALTIAFLAVLAVARPPAPRAPHPIPLVPVAILLAGYAAGHAVLPPIMRAAVAVATTLFCFYVAALKERPPIAFWAQVALALPVLPSLQFTLGYPMRIVSAVLATALLQVHGLVVARQGTFLVWHGEMVQFDAPCSGVNMLWAGLLLTLMGCVLLRLPAPKVMLAVGLSIILAIAGNVLRASSLFYVEAGLIPDAPGWWHDGIGIVAFTLSAAVTLWLLGRLRDLDIWSHFLRKTGGHPRIKSGGRLFPENAPEAVACAP
jgi:exosortase/archaeosortase family protein